MSDIKKYETVEGNIVLRDDDGFEKRFRVTHNEDGSTTYREDPNISIRMEKSPFEGLIPEDWESSKKRDPVGAQCTHFILMILYLGLTIGATVLLWIFVKDMVFRLGLLTGVLFVGIPCIRKEFEEQKEVNQLAADRLKEERERKKNK